MWISLAPRPVDGSSPSSLSAFELVRTETTGYKSPVQVELPTIEGRLVRRYKRFLTDVIGPDDELIVAHCPNTGSLKGCLQEGARVILRDSQDPKRKLRFTFQTIEVDGTWVNVDTGMPNTLVSESIGAGLIPDLAGYSTVRREVKYGKSSRIDALLEAPDQPACYVEVKSTTLVDGKVARFPDAVTSRGLKHLHELREMVSAGHRAVIFFCVSRGDVTHFSPADDIDSAYGKALREVVNDGVEAMAWSTHVTPTSFELHKPLKIIL